MATVTITTTAAQDAGIKYETDKYNALSKGALTPGEFAKAQIAKMFNGWADSYRDDTTVTKGEAYQKASALADAGDATAAADKATMDAILAKYGA